MFDSIILENSVLSSGVITSTTVETLHYADS